MASPEAIRERWCEILAQAHEQGLIDRRTLRIGAHCCFSQVGRDLSRYDEVVVYELLVKFLKDPVCELDGSQEELAAELCGLISTGEYEWGAALIEDLSGIEKEI